MNHPAWFRRTIFPGDAGTDVLAVQRLVGASSTGVLDSDTCALVRGLQRRHRRAISGVVDHDTALLIGEKATFGLVPEWFAAGDLSVLPSLLCCGESDVEDHVRRFQSAHHIYPTGVVDESTAIALGDT